MKSPRPPWRRWLHIFAVVAVAVELVLAAVLLLHRDTSRLPGLPELAGQPAALVDHLRRADEAARGSPRSAAAVGALGMAYHSNNFHEQAARSYALARELDPGDWRWPYHEVLLQDELGENISTIDGLRHVVALNPRQAHAWYRLGQAELKRDRFEAAEEAYQQAIRAEREEGPRPAASSEPRGKTFPIEAYASLGIAQAKLRRGEPGPAREILEKLTRTQPGFGQAHRLLGMALDRLGEREAAERETALATSCAPFYPPADPMVDALARGSSSSAFLLRQMGLAVKSANHAWADYLGRRAIAVGGGDPDAYFQLGQLYFDLRRWGDALPWLERFTEISKDRDMVLRVTSNMGVALLRLGKHEEALDALRRALPGNPSPEGVHLNMAAVLFELGRVAEAREHVGEALKLKPDYAEAHCTLGMLLMREGKLQEARLSLERAVRIRPGYADAWVSLAEVCKLDGSFEEAVRHYRSALERSPDSAAILSNLAWILATCPEAGVRSGEEAVRLAQKACQLTRYADVQSLDALGASLAEANDFQRAVEAADRAIALAAQSGQAGALDGLKSRKSLYQSGRPYREEYPPRR